MVKRALIFIVVLYAVSILNSCRNRMTFYVWEDFNIEIIDNSSTREETIYLDVNNPIPIAKLGLRVRPTFYRTFSQTRTFNVISEVQAQGCPIDRRLHSITSIVIKVVNEDSGAGIDVTSLFKGRLFLGGLEYSIDELIYQFNRRGFCGGGFLHREILDFYLDNDSIDLTGKQTFEITITFDDGIVLTQKTEELTLI